MKEIYKNISWNTNYQISNFGSVFSKRSNRIITSQTEHTGYISIKIGKNIRRKIHVLVAQAFIPNPENKPEVNHKDGVKYNNHVSNLEWMTRSENMKHAYELGLYKRKGDNSPRSVLSMEQVKEIRDKYKPRVYTLKMLAEEYYVCKATIGHVISRRNWDY